MAQVVLKDWYTRAVADTRFLKLDCSNDPLTAPLEISTADADMLRLHRDGNTVNWAAPTYFALNDSLGAEVDYAIAYGGIAVNTAGAHEGYYAISVADGTGPFAVPYFFAQETLRITTALSKFTNNVGINKSEPALILHSTAAVMDSGYIRWQDTADNFLWSLGNDYVGNGGQNLWITNDTDANVPFYIDGHSIAIGDVIVSPGGNITGGGIWYETSGWVRMQRAGIVVLDFGNLLNPCPALTVVGSTQHSFYNSLGVSTQGAAAGVLLISGTSGAEFDDYTVSVLGGGTRYQMTALLDLNNAVTNINALGMLLGETGNARDFMILSDSDNFYLKNITSDKDIYINANDGGVDTTAIKIVGATGQIQFPDATALASSLNVGGDADLFRNAANELTIPDMVRIGQNTSDTDVMLSIKPNSDIPFTAVNISRQNADTGGYITSNQDNDLMVNGGVKLAASGLFEARSITASIMRVVNGQCLWYTNTGLTAGNTYTPTLRATLTGSLFQTEVPITVNAAAIATLTVKSTGTAANIDINSTTSNTAVRYYANGTLKWYHGLVAGSNYFVITEQAVADHLRINANGQVILISCDDSTNTFRLGTTVDMYENGANLLTLGSGDSFNLLDNSVLKLGTGLDATILYDGTDLIINPKAVGAGVVSVLGDVEIASSNAYYLGDAATDGTWRIIRSGNDLSFERRESGIWNNKGYFVA